MLQAGKGPDQPPVQFPRTTGDLQAIRAESGSVDTAPRRSRGESPRIAVDSDSDTGIPAQRHCPHVLGDKASRDADCGQLGVGGPQHDMAPQLRMRAGETHRLIQFSHRDAEPHRGGFQPRVQRFIRPRCSAQRERAQRRHHRCAGPQQCSAFPSPEKSSCSATSCRVFIGPRSACHSRRCRLSSSNASSPSASSSRRVNGSGGIRAAVLTNRCRPCFLARVRFPRRTSGSCFVVRLAITHRPGRQRRSRPRRGRRNRPRSHRRPPRGRAPQ